VISVALKTPLEMTLRICIYCTKRHFYIDPMTILVSHQAVPPTFYNKIAPMATTELSHQRSLRLRILIRSCD